MRIIHLSDFHFSKNSRTNLANFYGDALLKDLEVIKKKKVINYIVVTGDIIDKSGKSFLKTEDPYKIFEKEFIEKVMNKLDFIKDDFIINPGNHDILGYDNKNKELNDLLNNLKSPEDINNLLFFSDKKNNKGLNILINRMKYYKNFEKNFYRTSDHTRIEEFASYLIRESDEFKVGFACLNSSWSCLKKNEGEKEKILLGTQQIYDAYNFFKDNKCNLLIALIHHPLEIIDNIEKNTIIEAFNKYFNIVFMGHTHKIKEEYFSGFYNNVFYNRARKALGCTNEIIKGIKFGYTVIDINRINRNKSINISNFYRKCDNMQHFTDDNEIEKFEGSIICKKTNQKNNNYKIILENEIEQININENIKKAIYIKINEIEDVNPIYIAKYPVTVNLYQKFLNYLNPKTASMNLDKLYPFEKFTKELKNIARKNEKFTKYLELAKAPEWYLLMESKLPRNRRFKEFFSPNKPIVGITQFDALSYCAWLTVLGGANNKNYIFRLPKQKEWDQAAYRGNDEHPIINRKINDNDLNDSYYFHIEHPEKYPKVEYPRIGGPVDVNDKDEFTYDLSQMGGNIWEWLDDYYGSSDRPLLKGGAWYSTKYDLQKVSFWYATIPTWWDYGVGFRVVLEIKK